MSSKSLRDIVLYAAERLPEMQPGKHKVRSGRLWLPPAYTRMIKDVNTSCGCQPDDAIIMEYPASLLFRETVNKITGSNGTDLAYHKESLSIVPVSLFRPFAEELLNTETRFTRDDQSRAVMGSIHSSRIDPWSRIFIGHGNDMVYITANKPSIDIISEELYSRVMPHYGNPQV